MPKNCDARVGAKTLYHLRKQSEVVVLHEQQGRFGSRHFLSHSFGKFLVCSLVALPVGGAKNWASVGDVAEGPQTFVGEAIVVAFFLFLRKPDAAERVFRLVGGNTNAISL